MSYMERWRNRLAGRGRVPMNAQPQVGAVRKDGKLYTGRDYGWQTRGSAASAGLLGSEVTGGYVPPRPPAQDFDRYTERGFTAPTRAFTSGGGTTGMLPGNTSVPMVIGGASTRDRAVSTAAQNAAQSGVPGWNWNDHQTMRDAAMGAGRAAAQARGDTVNDQGYITRAGGGYLSGDALPATSDPGQDAYWARADMNAWAQANKGLAMKQGWDPNRNYSDAMNASSIQGIGPVADGDQYARNLGAVQGTTGIGPVADGDTYGQMLSQPSPAPQTQGSFPALDRNEVWPALPVSRAQGIGPVADGGEYGRNLAAVAGTTGVGPVADGDTYGQMLLGDHLRRIKAGAQR